MLRRLKSWWLLRKLQSNCPSTVEAAEKSLSTLAEPSLIPALIPLLGERWHVKCAAWQVLESIDPNWEKTAPGTAGLLRFAERVNAKQGQLPSDVVEALGRSGDPRALPCLAVALENVQECAIGSDGDNEIWGVPNEPFKRALASFGSAAIPTIRPLLASKNEYAKSAAREVLAVLKKAEKHCHG